MGSEPLSVGEHRFSLQVVDSSGNQSTAAVISVYIVDSEAPTAILRVYNSQGQPSTHIPFGERFTLDASMSSDSGGGTIDRYIWSIVDVT